MPDETILEVGSNSYQEYADANAFFTERLTANAWENATVANRERALVMAYRAINRLPRFAGVPVAGAQTEPWPRRYVYDHQGNEYPYGDGTETEHYPLPLRQAQCLEALELLQRAADAGQDAAARDRARGISERRTSEGASVKYTDDAPVAGAALQSAEAWTLIRPLLSHSFAGTRLDAPRTTVNFDYIGGRRREGV